MEPTPLPATDPAWAAALSGWLQTHRAYPEAARRRGQQGSVGMRFTITRDGRVQKAAIATGSGFDLLDEAALAMLQDARVPEFPATMAQASITVTVTIHFTLAK